MLELFCLGELRQAVREWGPVRRLVDAVILALVALQLMIWCAEIVRLWLQP